MAVLAPIAMTVDYIEAERFKSLSPAEHLRKAKAPDVPYWERKKHLEAIPANAPEMADVPKLRDEINTREQESLAADNARIQMANERSRAKKARESLGPYLEQKLKELGYDVSVSISDDNDEVIVTSSDFSDTDHRVRFLAFVRGKKSPLFSACSNGLTKVRLRISDIPLLGFSESYSLDCGGF